MARLGLLEAIERRVLLGDGAMGTQLQLAGLQPGQCGELWNLDRPEAILEIQRRYAKAGSDCILTNTFGANAACLAKHGLATKGRDINRAAARIARQAVGADRYALGDVGPLGEMLEPFGTLSEAEAERMFREQIEALLEGGVDALIVETMMSLEELLCAVRAARAVTTDTPVIASMAYDRLAGGGYATMMGTRPEEQAARAIEAGADIVACNCGTGLSVEDHAAIVAAFRAVCDRPLMTQPNAGRPEVHGDTVIYRETPEAMAAMIPRLVGAGARLIGGCCGTTPAHIAAFRKAIDALA